MTNQRTKVYKYIQRRKTPVTRAEIVRALGIPHPTVCRRVEELKQYGLIDVTATRRGAAETLGVVS